MKVNFIGHGLHGYSETVGDYICSSLKNPKFNKFIAFSAFTKMSAFNIIREDLLNAKNLGKEIKFYLGIVPKGTSKEALEFLVDNNLESFTYFNETFIFHPKIYLFEGDKRTRIILGSSNLTSQGLFKNIEASVIIDFLNSDSTGQKFKSQFTSYFKTILDGSESHTKKLTKELIEDFIKNEIIFDEIFTYDNIDNIKKKKSKSKEKTKRILKSELGNIKDEKFRKYDYERKYELTPQYLVTWKEFLEIYKTYIKDNDTVVVKRDTDISGLYTWYRKQKHFYKTNEIPSEHKSELEKLNFPFEDAHNIEWDKAWEAKYDELVNYYNENGVAWVKRIRDKSNPLKSLSDWCALQRSYYHLKTLPDYRFERLDDINFPWSIPNIGMLPDDESWFEHYLELEAYKKRHGNCHPPQVNPNGSRNKLGRWVNDQMTLKNVGRMSRRTGERIFLNPIREEYLTELGVIWDYELTKHKKSFDKQVKDFLKYRQKHPDLKPPTGKFKKERDWLSQMRYKFDTLPDWKREILIENEII